MNDLAHFVKSIFENQIRTKDWKWRKVTDSTLNVLFKTKRDKPEKYLHRSLIFWGFCPKKIKESKYWNMAYYFLIVPLMKILKNKKVKTNILINKKDLRDPWLFST